MCKKFSTAYLRRFVVFLSWKFNQESEAKKSENSLSYYANQGWIFSAAKITTCLLFRGAFPLELAVT